MTNCTSSDPLLVYKSLILSLENIHMFGQLMETAVNSSSFLSVRFWLSTAQLGTPQHIITGLHLDTDYFLLIRSWRKIHRSFSQSRQGKNRDFDTLSYTLDMVNVHVNYMTPDLFRTG